MHIDWWTLALQTVNVLVLIWILARFFFRPVADIVAKRQAEADKLLSDATAARQQAADARAEADKMRADMGTERERLAAEARKAAQADKERLLAQAAQEAAKLRSEGQAEIARDQAAAERATIEHASELAVDIARRLLTRLPPGASLAEFLAGLRQRLDALSPDMKADFTAATVDQPVEVVTAAPLSEAQADEARKTLRDVLGADVAVQFRSDPAVIAGIELHGRNTIVRNSWRADLDGIREELKGGQQPGNA